jgi:hypothetical protein
MPSIQTVTVPSWRLQRVVDRDRIEDRAAGAVEPQIDGRALGQRAEFGEKPLRRDPVGADLVIDRHFRARSPGRGSHTSLPCRHSCSVDGSVAAAPSSVSLPASPGSGRVAGVARALRLARARAVAQAEACRARGVGGVLAVDFLDVVAGGLDHLAPRGDAGLDRQHLRLDVLQRIDPVPARRDPLHRLAAPAGSASSAPGEHRRLQPAPPDRAAELVHDHAMLQLANAAAELDEFGAQGLE